MSCCLGRPAVRRFLLIGIATILFIGNSPGSFCRGADRLSRKTDDSLLQKVDRAIAISKRRYLTAGVHTPWQIMHGLLALRGDYQIKDKSGRLINVADWISGGVYFQGEPWFRKTEYGAEAHPYTSDYVFEGHVNQFLAIMASAGFSADHRLKAGNVPITVRDLINNSKKETSTQDEITWTLWALSHYLSPDASWTNKYGESWSIARLVAVQNQQELSRSACGGTHGLFALAYARRQYLKTGRPLRGVWLTADQRIRRYIEEARSYQNTDGTFSSNYFQGYGYSRNFEKRLSSTGHILEFLMIALPDKRLNEAWIRKAVDALATDLIENKHKPAEPGALYHALDALVLYRGRITGEYPPAASAPRKRRPVAARRPRLRDRSGSVTKRSGRSPSLTLPLPPKP